MSKTAQNYYEILELSENANKDTIERMFRYLAVKHHPDSGGDKEEFSILLKAFEVLRDPVSRDAYDAQLQQQYQDNAKLAEHARQAGPDVGVRHKLLCLYYNRRRQDVSNSSIGAVTIQKKMELPEEVLEFHVWFLREKGWLKRGENGGLQITAAGVERVEAGHIVTEDHTRIEAHNPSIATPMRQVARATPAVAVQHAL